MSVLSKHQYRLFNARRCLADLPEPSAKFRGIPVTDFTTVEVAKILEMLTGGMYKPLPDHKEEPKPVSFTDGDRVRHVVEYAGEAATGTVVRPDASFTRVAVDDHPGSYLFYTKDLRKIERP